MCRRRFLKEERPRQGQIPIALGRNQTGVVRIGGQEARAWHGGSWKGVRPGETISVVPDSPGIYLITRLNPEGCPALLIFGLQGGYRPLDWPPQVPEWCSSASV